jgi:hypothetical protein
MEGVQRILAAVSREARNLSEKLKLYSQVFGVYFDLTIDTFDTFFLGDPAFVKRKPRATFMDSIYQLV